MLTPLNQQQGQPSMHGIGAQMAAQGRGPDSTLVHMAPSEVAGLNALAQSHLGRPLTINPTTGLPEAGILSSLLPMVIGAVLTPLTGGLINPMTAGLLVGAGTGLVTHDLGKGLMAGLGAFGGAGMGAALFGGGASAGALFGSAGKSVLAKQAAEQAAAGAMNVAVPEAAATATAAPVATEAATEAAKQLAARGLTEIPVQSAVTLAKQAAPSFVEGLKTMPDFSNIVAPQGGLMGAAKGIGSSFAENLRAPGLVNVPGVVPRMVTTGLGTTGLLSGLSGAMSAGVGGVPANVGASQGKVNYLGPYKPVERNLIPSTQGRNPTTDSGEHQWFDNVNPYPGFTTADGGIPPGYPGGPPLLLPEDKPAEVKKHWYDFADGGMVSLKPGGFVMDARTVSELGNGNTEAGQELLKQHGGKPIKGRGDGVSDSIPAKIKGKGTTQAARVSSGEVKFDPKAVQRMGGPQKLYAIMQRAERSRAAMSRGKSNGLAS